MFPVIVLHKSNTCFSSFSRPMRAIFPKNLSLHRSLRPRIDHHPSSPRTASPVFFPLPTVCAPPLTTCRLPKSHSRILESDEQSYARGSLQHQMIDHQRSPYSEMPVWIGPSSQTHLSGQPRPGASKVDPQVLHTLHD